MATETQEHGPEESARKRHLLDAAYGWVLEHGWAGMSLRPLAEAIESSPRVLLFLFASKDGLIRALLARSRAEQLAVLDQLPAHEPTADLAEVARRMWAWLAADEHRALLRLWVETYSRSLSEPKGPWAGFAEQTVTDWDQLLAAYQAPDRRTTHAGVAERALLLAVLRGALLDMLATGDTDRLNAAVEQHITALTSRTPSG